MNLPFRWGGVFVEGSVRLLGIAFYKDKHGVKLFVLSANLVG